jgi:hypothetical protein
MGWWPGDTRPKPWDIRSDGTGSLMQVTRHLRGRLHQLGTVTASRQLGQSNASTVPERLVETTEAEDLAAFQASPIHRSAHGCSVIGSVPVRAPSLSFALHCGSYNAPEGCGRDIQAK